MNRNNNNFIIAVFLILIATVSRIVNAKLHIPNFVPIAAIGVFSGAILKDKRSLAFLVPVLGQFLADLWFSMSTDVVGFYGFAGQSFNYLAIIGATALGVSMKQVKPLTALTHVFGASTLFFIVSNFGYYLGGWNTYSFSGLTKTYIDAIPFFKNSLGADLVGGVLLFGSYFAARSYFARKTQKVTA